MLFTLLIMKYLKNIIQGTSPVYYVIIFCVIIYCQKCNVFYLCLSAFLVSRLRNASYIKQQNGQQQQTAMNLKQQILLVCCISFKYFPAYSHIGIAFSLFPPYISLTLYSSLYNSSQFLILITYHSHWVLSERIKTIHMEINIFNIVLNNDAKPFSDSTTITNTKNLVATIAKVIKTIGILLLYFRV